MSAIKSVFSISNVLSSGQISTGGVLSTTIKLAIPIVSFPQSSSRFHSTLTWPRSLGLEEEGSQVVLNETNGTLGLAETILPQPCRFVPPISLNQIVIRESIFSAHSTIVG